MVTIDLFPWFFVFVAVVNVVCALACWSEAAEKGYDQACFALMGLIFGVVGVLIAWVAPDQDRLLTVEEARERKRQRAIAASQAPAAPSAPADALEEARERLRRLPRDVE